VERHLAERSDPDVVAHTGGGGDRGFEDGLVGRGSRREGRSPKRTLAAALTAEPTEPAATPAHGLDRARIGTDARARVKSEAGGGGASPARQRRRQARACASTSSSQPLSA